MIECNCSVTDYDGPEVFREEWRRAAKQHKCCECGDAIEIGEEHEYVTGLWDGVWDTHRTCQGCINMRRRFCPDGWLYGGLGEAVYECTGIDPYIVPTQDDVDDEEDPR
jgi:hypothetical protein